MKKSQTKRVFGKKRIIGLTGYFASGKTTVAQVFESFGYQVIEMDILGHRALVDQKKEVLALFGKGILDSLGNIDRSSLARIVFKDSDKLQSLERILHPKMLENLDSLILHTPAQKILISAAILVSMGIHRVCQKVFKVVVHEDKIIQRAFQRDRFSLISVEQRLKSQSRIKMTSDFAESIIDNNGSIQDLKTRAKEIINSLDEVV